MNEEAIWYRDLAGFISTKEQLYSLIPLPESSLASQLNAVLRFSIYYGIIVFIFQLSTKALLIPLIVAGITYAIYETDDATHTNERESLRVQGFAMDPETKRVCMEPSVDNPFMNVLATDYAKHPNRPGACDVTKPATAKRVNELYEEKFPNAKYSRDIYGRNTGLRQFYSNPSTTIPNDQGTFAKWLYSDRSIKQSQKAMLSSRY